jgi:tyrosinase
MAASEIAVSRFEKVREILKTAGSTSDYDGLGPLWNVSHKRLLEASLHGVRLIAPEAAHSCCSHMPSAPGASRAARSGLIQGLRGEAPFDGVRFPRLPWGGSVVAASDIDFIAQWIDDGCPATDKDVEFDLAPEKPVTITLTPVIPPSAEPEEICIPEGGVNEYMFERGELKQRMNIDCMNETQLAKLRYAFRELYELNKWPEDSRSYNNQALIHQNHCQHGWERFLPWHRIYLYEFEQALQDHCPDVTLPYWDWTMRRYKPETPEKGDIIPKSFQGYLTPKSLDFLGRNGFPDDVLKILGDSIVGHHYVSPTTFFAAVAAVIDPKYTKGEHRNRFIDALLAANSLWYPLRYPAEYHDDDGNDKINTVIHYHYPTAEDIQQILSLRTFRDFGGGSSYDDAFGFIDQNPHNTLHIWTGGMNPDAADAKVPADRNKSVKVVGRRFHTRDDMYSRPGLGDMFSNLTASYDPVFWPIHANVDRLWSEWQQMHPNSNPVDLDSVLTPWGYTVRDTLDMQRFGYEYVKSSWVLAVPSTAPVGRFVSPSVDVPEPVRQSFERAEVRLHRVPQLPRSCFIRVFLNLPDANASTPLDDPHYAGYAAVFGHGDCYGGPGHCDPPPARPRKYDLRPRSHNTPRNHRVNVTRCAKRLIEEKATSLQITLVVIGADYREEKELLRLEGVSLNFLD